MSSSCRWLCGRSIGCYESGRRQGHAPGGVVRAPVAGVDPSPGLLDVRDVAGVLARPDAWWGRRFLPVLEALAVAGSAVRHRAPAVPGSLLPRQPGAGATRSLRDAAMYAGTWKDYLSTPSTFHYPLWSHRFFVGTALFPGALGILLTLVVVARGGLREPRVRMCLAVGVVGVLLSFGPALPGYAHCSRCCRRCARFEEPRASVIWRPSAWRRCRAWASSRSSV